eukprot:m.171144 g.171144  ORF g.171144 m.171144 type:complete len:1295 (+) comp16702_c0_seq2:210-4094(+)
MFAQLRTRLRSAIRDTFYWHGLLCASNPFQVIITSAFFAFVLSWPTICLLLQPAPALTSAVWHSTTSSAQTQSGLRMDAVPPWYHDKHNDVHLQQLHVISSPRDNVLTPDHYASLDYLTTWLAKPAADNTSMLARMQEACVTYDELPAHFNTSSEPNAWHWPAMQALIAPVTAPPLSLHPKRLVESGRTRCLVVSLTRAVQHTQPDLHAALLTKNASSASTRQLRSLVASLSAVRVGGIQIPPDALAVNVRLLRRFTSATAIPATIVLKRKVLNSTQLEKLAIEMEEAFCRAPIGVGQGLCSRLTTGVSNSGTAHLYYGPATTERTETWILLVAYITLFLYISFSVSRFHAVKSKFGLGIAVVSIVTASITTAVGVCHSLGLVPSARAIELVPFLVMAIGLDNITTITQCVEASDPSIAVRFRIAEGLSKAGGALTKSLLQMELLLLLGSWSPLATMSDFCTVAAVAMFTDFNFQVIIYVSVLSLDTRRLELSDFLSTTQTPVQTDMSIRSFWSYLRPSTSKDATALDTHHGVRWKAPHSHNIETDALSSDALKSVQQSGTGRVIVVNNLLILLGMCATVILAVLRGASFSQAPSSVEATIQANWMPTYQGLQQHDARALIVFPPPLTFKLDDPSTQNAAYQFLDLIQLDLVRIQATVELLFTWAGLTLFLALVGAWYLLYQITLIVRRRLFGLRENMDALAPLSLLSFHPATLKGHSQEIECMATCKQSRRGVTTTMDGHVRVWDLEDHRLLAALKLRMQLGPGGTTPDSSLVSHSDSVVRLNTGHASPESGQDSDQDSTVVHSPSNELDESVEGGLDVVQPVPWCVDIYGDSIAIGCSDGSVVVWDLESGAMQALVQDVGTVHDGVAPVSRVKFWKGLLLVTSASGVLEVWKWARGETDAESPIGTPIHVPTHRRHGSTGSTPSQGAARPLLSALSDSPMLVDPSPRRGRHSRSQSWDLRDVSLHEGLATTSMPQSPARPLPLDPWATFDPSERPDRAAGGMSPSLGPVTGLSRQGSVSQLLDTTAEARGTCGLIFRSYKATTSSAKLVDNSSGYQTCMERVYSVKAHQEGIVELCTLGDYILTASQDKQLKVWRSLDLSLARTLNGHSDPISCMATHSGPVLHSSRRQNHALCANTVVSGSRDGEIRVWDLDTYACVSLLHGHEAEVIALRCSGEHIVSSSNDHTLRLWVRATGRCMRTLNTSTPLLAMTLHESNVLLTVSEGCLTAWDLMAGGERLRTVALEETESRRIITNNHALLSQDHVMCDYGKAVKVLHVPFPTLRHRQRSKKST